eukprot:1176011-Prorocentrum_minimum.AAC.1
MHSTPQTQRPFPFSQPVLSSPLSPTSLPFGPGSIARKSVCLQDDTYEDNNNILRLDMFVSAKDALRLLYRIRAVRGATYRLLGARGFRRGLCRRRLGRCLLRLRPRRYRGRRLRHGRGRLLPRTRRRRLRRRARFARRRQRECGLLHPLARGVELSIEVAKLLGLGLELLGLGL